MSKHAGAPSHRPSRMGTSARAATVMLVCLVLTACTAEAIEPATEPTTVSSNSAPAYDRPPSPRSATVGEGLVAFSSGFAGGDIYVVRSGETARRVLGADGDDLDQVCPAFSPDGARLASGQAAGHSQVGWGRPALVITDLTASGEPRTSTVIPLRGVNKPPCPIWSPDGRWVAFNTRGGPASPGAPAASSGSSRSPRAKPGRSRRSRRPTSNGHRTGMSCMWRTGVASWSIRSPPRRCGRYPTPLAPSLSRYRRTARCSRSNGVTVASGANLTCG